MGGIPVRELAGAYDRVDGRLEIFVVSRPAPGDAEAVDAVDTVSTDAQEPDAVGDLVFERVSCCGFVGLGDDLGDVGL